MLFTFRRDADGRETIHVGDVAIARVTDHPEGFEWLNSMPGITAEHVREAAVKADEAGFWTPMCSCPCSSMMHYQDVDVPIAESTSTTLTVTNEDDQS